jgi:hypothetical protein
MDPLGSPETGKCVEDVVAADETSWKGATDRLENALPERRCDEGACGTSDE